MLDENPIGIGAKPDAGLLPNRFLRYYTPAVMVVAARRVRGKEQLHCEGGTEREDRRRDDPADDNGGQGPLHFGSGAVAEGVIRRLG